MGKYVGRILIVEENPEISSFIEKQALAPLGYQVLVAPDATVAIQKAVQYAPHAVIANLNLPGLSGKDLLIALSSQGINVPVIILASKGMESSLIHAFRLGASDYLIWPVRETEIVAAVERVLELDKNKQKRENLTRQLKRANLELQNRIRELNTIITIGKTVVSQTDQSVLYNKLIEGAVQITTADLGWFYVRLDENKPFILAAQRGLPEPFKQQLYKPWDDGISSLVALSGEPLAIHGKPLNRFKASGLGQSILVTPVKVNKKIIGLLSVMRKVSKPFDNNSQNLLKAIADYASISMINAGLFQALDDRSRESKKDARRAQINEQITADLINYCINTLTLAYPRLSGQESGAEHRDSKAPQTSVSAMQLKLAIDTMHLISEPAELKTHNKISKIDLTKLVLEEVSRLEPVIEEDGLEFATTLPDGPIYVSANHFHIAQAVNGLLTNALQHASKDSHIQVRLTKTDRNYARITVIDQGLTIDPKDISRVYQPNHAPLRTRINPQVGIGISLALIKEIIEFHGGTVSVRSDTEQGTSFHVYLPIKAR